MEATASRGTVQRAEKGKAGKEAKDKESRREKAKVTSNGEERGKEKGKVHAGNVEASTCRGAAREIRPVGVGPGIKRDPWTTPPRHS